MEHYTCSNPDLSECRVVTFTENPDDGDTTCPSCGYVGMRG